MNANYKCTVSVRIPTGDNDVYRSELRSLSRVPVVGEYVRISAREHWWKQSPGPRRFELRKIAGK